MLEPESMNPQIRTILDCSETTNKDVEEVTD